MVVMQFMLNQLAQQALEIFLCAQQKKAENQIPTFSKTFLYFLKTIS